MVRPAVAGMSDCVQPEAVHRCSGERALVAVRFDPIPAHPAHHQWEGETLPDERREDHGKRHQLDQAALGKVEGQGERTFARATMYRLGLDAVRHARDRWPDHVPLHDRLESGLGDRMQHLATEDAEETEERRKEHLEHQEIQLYVINAQRAAAIALRDGGEITTRRCANSSASWTWKSFGWRPEIGVLGSAVRRATGGASVA